MKKLAVFGNPVKHSLSPTIHQMFAESCNEIISYEKIECSTDGFVNTLLDYFNDPDVIGCNITVPFKQDAFALLKTNCDDYANQAQAVNTVRKTDTLSGFNTDGIGLRNDLLAQVGSLLGCSILLIGAGGAARGVVQPLISAGISKLHITNRTHTKAISLVNQFNDDVLEAIAPEELGANHYDIIINCTSASLEGRVPDLGSIKFNECALAYDMVYGNQPTVFMHHAAHLGAKRCSDGLGMLVGQAAEAFYIWTGKRPETKDVQAALKNT
ncbi:shikimate dehydrogenase [Alteromonas sp. ASW11-130]|uniref:shikimate dehydrogenase n=1 Tax=Alteromonas sp. ASW11-130 TaxID=3015775 RepID=UPI0022422C17|nr:shikimate dehydrogenase [Alteromonas sp. ASW11-130]MCW8093478.1 shikimate dehydrogenase [Alteromonas sp. ASW11-130]